MKKLIAMLLAMVMVLGLVACAAKTEPPAADTKTETPAAETPAAETPAEETPAEETPAAEGAVKTDEIATEGKAAELGIPAAVVLQDTTALEGKKIGCSICYKGDEWCAALAQALEALGAYYGADIVCEDGDLNDETQTKQIENMISNNVDIIMVDPITPDGSGIALTNAVEAGIPVIIYDGYWTDGEEKAVTTVTWDQKATGTLVGEYFVNYVKENNGGKCRVVELTNAVSTHCQERFVGLHEVIDAANADGCEIEILNKYDSQGNRETAYNAISAVVEPYDYVISDVDNGAMGAAEVIKANGDPNGEKCFVIGIDGGKQSWSYIRDDSPLKYSYAQPMEQFAHIEAELIRQIQIEGMNPGDPGCLLDKAGNAIYTEGTIVTKDNVPAIGTSIHTAFDYYDASVTGEAAWWDWTDGPGIYMVEAYEG